MIYEETSGTSPDNPYETNGLSEFFLLLEDGGYLLLETGGRIFLEISIPNQNLYDSNTGTNPADVYSSNSGVGPFLFYETTGASPDNPYEEN